MARKAVLVLDDNPAFVRAVTVAADAAGLDVRATDRADDFSTMIGGEGVIAAIVDCMLEGSSGLATLAEISAANHALPTLVVSGYGEGFLAQAEQLGRSHGLTRLATLAKPFGIADLRGFLASARTHADA
jgi:DNA-binding NtrC family response regulator